jgi:hypothetical protein
MSTLNRRGSILIPLMLALGMQSAQAGAPEVGTLRELEVCQAHRDLSTKPDSLRVTTQGEITSVVIEASLNCGAKVNHKVTSGEGFVSIALSHPAGGPFTACTCMRRFELRLPQSIKPGTTVYLVNHGVATAHKSAA